MSKYNFISALCGNYPVSGIRAMFDLAAGYPGAINLCNGEPNFETPKHIVESAVTALREGRTKYGTEPGLPAMRQAVANKYIAQFGRDYDIENVMVTLGGVEGIFMSLSAILNPGDEVIIPDPAYTCYEGQVLLLGGKPVRVPLYEEHGFRLQPEDLEAAITPKTKALIVTYPSNPLGAVLDRADGEALAKVIARHPIMVISDEVYEKILFDGREHFSLAQIESIKDQVLVVNSLSKTYAMTGWRLGYCAGPKPVMKQMLKLHQYCIMSSPTVSQYAAITALTQCRDDVDRMLEEYDMRRRLVVKGFNDMGLTCFEPEGAFYVFPCIKSTGMKSSEFCEKLIYSKKVAVVPGSAFGESGEGYVRVSYAYSVQHITTALQRIKEFVEELKK